MGWFIELLTSHAFCRLNVNDFSFDLSSVTSCRAGHVTSIDDADWVILSDVSFDDRPESLTQISY